MPTYQRFEDLPVWQTAADLYEQCDNFLEQAPSRLRHSVRDQLERAALSVLQQHCRRLRAWDDQRTPGLSLHRARFGRRSPLDADNSGQTSVDVRFQI